MRPTRELYCDEHRGIKIEVSRHYPGGDRKPDGVWCFYLHLLVEQFPEEIRGDLLLPHKVLEFGSWIQPYPECLESLDWHSGMTFYEVNRTPEPFRAIKAGCDYDHLWDEGRIYNSDFVMMEAKECVDSLWRQFPTLKTARECYDEYYKSFKEQLAQKANALPDLPEVNHRGILETLAGALKRERSEG
jgi:hypothetical protein